jgi:hypothetical protein
MVWLGACWLAPFLADRDPWRLAAPAFHLMAIGLPAYLLIRLATGGLKGGSRGRLWGLLSAGVLLGPGVAAVAEIGIIFCIAVAAAGYLSMHPEKIPALQHIASQLAHASGTQDAAAVLMPWVLHPLALLLALLVFAVLTPVIEELAKSISPWILFDRLHTPAHGFWAGAIAGAGFGLFEGLVASADPGSSWRFVLVARAGSTLMHVISGALSGWGLARFRLTHKRVHLLAGYALAMAIHAIWNASVVTAGFGGLRVGLNDSRADVLGVAMLFVGGALLAALLVTMPVGLVLANRRLQSSPPVSPPLESRPARGPGTGRGGPTGAGRG